MASKRVPARMRLQRSLIRTSKASGARFYRYLVPVPGRAIKAAGWTKDAALECEVLGDAILIRPKKRRG